MQVLTSLKLWLLSLVNMVQPNADASSILYVALCLTTLFGLSFALLFIGRTIVKFTPLDMLVFRRSQWRDTIAKYGTIRRFSHLFPAIVIYIATPGLLDHSPQLVTLLQKACVIYMLIALLMAIYALLNSVEGIYNQSSMSKRAPITGFVQVAKLVFFIITALLVVSVLLDTSPALLLSGLTAMAAVLLLIFRDTILGFVAGIQIAANRMVNNGDWIVVPRYNADGEVIEIGLTIVKVRNWDNTVTTMPTYALTQEEVKNYRWMQESGGRRIKRAIHLDVASIRFVDDDWLAQLNQNPLLRSAKLQIDENERTNLGVFRQYLEWYLSNHKDINTNLTTMVRLLKPTEVGLPIELYCFSAEKRWVAYEAIQAAILDHVFASLPLFELRAYQRVSNQT